MRGSSWGSRRTGKTAMVGTRGAAAAASSDRDAGGTSRAAPSSSAATGGNEETGGSPNNTEVSHDDVDSKHTRIAEIILPEIRPFGSNFNLVSFSKNNFGDVAG